MDSNGVIDDAFNYLPKNDKQNVQSFYKLGILKNFAKFTRKHLCLSIFYCRRSACNFINKKLQPRCFPVNFVKPLIIPFQQNISDSLQLCQNFNPCHSRLFFWPTPRLYGPIPPTPKYPPAPAMPIFNPRLNFMDRRYPHHPRQNFTPSTHAPTPSMLHVTHAI